HYSLSLSCCSIASFFVGSTDSHIHVVRHKQHTQQEQGATDYTHHVTTVRRFNRFNEAVSQGAVGVYCTPHQTLHNAVHQHRSDVHDSMDEGQKQVCVGQWDRVHNTGYATKLNLDQVVQSTDRLHRNPAQLTLVNVANGPVSVVR